MDSGWELIGSLSPETFTPPRTTLDQALNDGDFRVEPRTWLDLQVGAQRYRVVPLAASPASPVQAPATTPVPQAAIP